MSKRRKRGLLWSGGVVVVFGYSFGAYVLTHMSTTLPMLGVALNYVRYWNAPAEALTTQTNTTETAAAAPLPLAVVPAVLHDDWPSYNKTLTSNRFSPLARINAENVSNLKVLCTYDTGRHSAFNTGPIKVNGALIATTGFDIFSIDPATCRENWSTHESYTPAAPMLANRGAAYMDGRLPAAPIAWNGLIFIQKIGGAIGGGVITYTVNGTQKIAVATGLTSILWPTEVTTAKISILGL